MLSFFVLFVEGSGDWTHVLTCKANTSLTKSFLKFTVPFFFEKKRFWNYEQTKIFSVCTNRRSNWSHSLSPVRHSWVKTTRDILLSLRNDLNNSLSRTWGKKGLNQEMFNFFLNLAIIVWKDVEYLLHLPRRTNKIVRKMITLWFEIRQKLFPETLLSLPVELFFGPHLL